VPVQHSVVNIRWPER